MKLIYASIGLKLLAIAISAHLLWIQCLSVYRYFVLHQPDIHTNMLPQFEAATVLSISLHVFWKTFFLVLAAWCASDLFQIQSLNGAPRPAFEASLEVIAMCLIGFGLFIIAGRAQKMKSDLEAIV